MSETLREVLARETGVLHRTLDRAPTLSILLRPGLGVDDYARALLRFALAHDRVEPVLLACDSAAYWSGLPPYRPRLPALRTALDALGVAFAPQGATAPGPQGAPFPCDPSETSRHRMLGLRYVLDGASQGARLLAPAVARALPTLSASALGYWQVQAQASADWPTLCEALSVPAEAADRSAALEAASWAFQQFIDAFSSRAPKP